MQVATSSTQRKPIQRNRQVGMMIEIAWHRRETRRTTENTNFDLRFRRGEIPEGLPRSLAPGMGKEKRRELERSHRFLGERQGMRIMSHDRGNPETEVCRNLNPNLKTGTPCQPNRRRAEGRWEVRLAHTTRRRESRSG